MTSSDKQKEKENSNGNKGQEQQQQKEEGGEGSLGTAGGDHSGQNIQTHTSNAEQEDKETERLGGLGRDISSL